MRFYLFLSLLTLFSCSSSSLKLTPPKQEGKVLTVAWNKNLDLEYRSGNLPIGVGAPRIYEDMVYMGALNGEMNAFDLETGRLIWSETESTPLGAPVAFFEDHVGYGGESGRFFVRHYLTGKLKYAIDLGSPIESAPVYHKGRLLIYLRGHQLAQLDAETGKIIWVYRRAVPITTTLQRTSKPLIIGNKIILGFADGFAAALSFEEGLLLWETRIASGAKFVDVDLNPILANGMVITGSPSTALTALNPDSGVINQTYPITSVAHPQLVNEQLLMGTNDGEVVLMSLSGEVLKQAKISELGISALAWWKGHIIAAAFDGKIYAVDPLEMKVVDHFSLGHAYSAVYSDLVANDSYLAVYSSRNRLYVFK
ncbi:MAG TPA: PQQ-binding-like beta-propeller repeat protein [Bacteriovoracaceae bacterium]|nr:PQQ-binding-like beta-propeller repeat protein [Bacteriovoracaceae bacterium]